MKIENGKWKKMNYVEECLKCLESGSWSELIEILKNNSIDLSESSIFSVFETQLINELKRHENERNEDSITAATTIFTTHEDSKFKFKLSDNAYKKLTKYLFDKNPSDYYARIISDDKEAIDFLEQHNIETEKKISKGIIGAHLNIKSNEQGELNFVKDIFNSPQEKELYFGAKEVFQEYILLPNTALSTIINNNVKDLLDKKTTTFFFKSTLDLCIVNPITFIPEIFIELDSKTWHDKPENQEKDLMKDKIFRIAGIELHRIRKKENLEMNEIFKLFLRELKDNL
ncbi:MAG: DUF2726 domain-containing protein [Fluviicola sp.]